MGIISIGDVEIASGVDIDAEDYPRYQFFIDAVSDYIETYTGQSFSERIEEVLICQTDKYGIIQFGDLTAVSLVESYDPYSGVYTAITLGDYGFDGIDCIFGLCGRATYRCTVTYGWVEPPDDIAALVTQLVLAGTGLDPAATAGNLKSIRTGDVEDVYGVSMNSTGGVDVSLSKLQASTLRAYTLGTTTWRI